MSVEAALPDPGIALRPAALEDRELLIDWWLATFADLREAAADPWFAGAVLTRDAATERVDAGLADDGLFLLAELGGHPVGFLLAGVEPPFAREATIAAIGHVTLVRVTPEARRRGVATALLAGAEAWFKARGLSWMQLSWHADNAVAAMTWHAQGFVPFRVFGRRRL